MKCNNKAYFINENRVSSWSRTETRTPTPEEIQIQLEKQKAHEKQNEAKYLVRVLKCIATIDETLSAIGDDLPEIAVQKINGMRAEAQEVLDILQK